MTGRNYEMDDDLLLQRSRVVRQLFINYLGNFSAFDSGLDAVYVANWLLSIDQCQSHPTDESTVDQLEGLTAAISLAEKEGFAAANGLLYYVKAAFPGDKTVLAEFGFTERKQARESNLNLLIWLEVMKRVATDYTAELTVAGMPSGILINLNLKQQNAVNAVIEQEYFKRIRKKLARQRIKKFNTLYSFLSRVNHAAENVFIDEPEERGLFVV